MAKVAPVRALILASLLLPSIALAQAPVPARGLANEVAGRWDEAIRIYRAELAHDPARGDLWVRIANIDASLNRLPDAIAALQAAIHASPSDPVLRIRLSQAYATHNDPAAALRAAEEAEALRPDTPEYLDAIGTLATWNADYSRASRAYQRLATLRPADADVALKLARVSAWAGLTDTSVAAYRRYLAGHSDAAPVWLELARTEGWRGNYAGAVGALNEYRRRFGTDTDYSLTLAGVLASGGRPDQAIDLLDPVLEANPTQYDALVTRTIALIRERRIGEARAALRSLRRLDPANAETRAAAALFRTELGSSVQPGFTFYSDSDHLQVAQFAPTGAVLLASDTTLSAGYQREILSAPREGGLGRSDGAHSRYDSLWAELSQALGPLTFSGRAATATADDRTRTPYAAGVQVRASDALTFGAERAFDFFVISPRTVELGLTQTRTSFDFDWKPTLQFEIGGDALAQVLSDGNQRWEATLTAHQAVARAQRFNLDLGASAYLLGTTRDLPDGYYDPRRYESYEAVAFPYFKISENVGLGLSLGAGVQRENGAGFQLGANAAGELNIGIYRAWLLKAGANVTHNRRPGSGAFQGYSGILSLTRRF